MTSSVALLGRLARPATATVLGCFALACTVFTCVVSPMSHNPGGNSSGAGELALIVVFGTIGLLIARRRPRNSIGWLFLGVAIFFVLGSASDSYAVLDYRLRHGSLPLGWVAVLLQDGWAPAIVLIVVSLLVFPDGRPATRLSRVAVWAILAVGAIWLLGASGIALQEVIDHSVRLDASGDLYAIDNATADSAWWVHGVQPVFFVTAGVAWLVWLVQQASLYRRARGDRRLQLKWLYGGGAVCVLGGFLTSLVSARGGIWSVISALGAVGLAALPVSVGIGVTKFHLYDVDRVVSRSIAYGLVTALVVGAYVGAIALFSKALDLSSPVAVAASTLAAAAIFNPLRWRVQRAVDRRFNRARYDAEATVYAFAARLRESVGLDVVRQDLASTVQHAVEPAQLVVWVRPASGSQAGR